MTSYIEGMMKATGIEPNRTKCNTCKNCSTCKLFKGVTGNRLNKFKTIEECQKASILYPNFTPKKQLEIFKLIGKNTKEVQYIDYKTRVVLCCITHWEECRSFTGEDFSQALAQLTIELMNAGELDKEKVKEILQ